jgi:hypothetical protein
MDADFALGSSLFLIPSMSRESRQFGSLLFSRTHVRPGRRPLDRFRGEDRDRE